MSSFADVKPVIKKVKSEPHDSGYHDRAVASSSVASSYPAQSGSSGSIFRGRKVFKRGKRHRRKKKKKRKSKRVVIRKKAPSSISSKVASSIKKAKALLMSRLGRDIKTTDEKPSSTVSGNFEPLFPAESGDSPSDSNTPSTDSAAADSEPPRSSVDLLDSILQEQEKMLSENTRHHSRVHKMTVEEIRAMAERRRRAAEEKHIAAHQRQRQLELWELDREKRMRHSCSKKGEHEPFVNAYESAKKKPLFSPHSAPPKSPEGRHRHRDSRHYSPPPDIHDNSEDMVVDEMSPVFNEGGLTNFVDINPSLPIIHPAISAIQSAIAHQNSTLLFPQLNQASLLNSIFNPNASIFPLGFDPTVTMFPPTSFYNTQPNFAIASETLPPIPSLPPPPPPPTSCNDPNPCTPDKASKRDHVRKIASAVKPFAEKYGKKYHLSNDSYKIMCHKVVTKVAKYRSPPKDDRLDRLVEEYAKYLTLKERKTK